MSYLGGNDFPAPQVLEKTLSPRDSKEIKPVSPKGNTPEYIHWKDFAEAPILWPPDTKSQVIGKDSDAGKDCGQKEKGGSRV